MSEINHPTHYGGIDNHYEAIKVIEACQCGFHIGNAIKYLSRAGKKEGQTLKKDLQKALWYLERMLSKGIKDGFVRTGKSNPYKVPEVALAWGLSKNLEAALSHIWHGNYGFALTQLKIAIEFENKYPIEPE